MLTNQEVFERTWRYFALLKEFQAFRKVIPQGWDIAGLFLPRTLYQQFPVVHFTRRPQTLFLGVTFSLLEDLQVLLDQVCANQRTDPATPEAEHTLWEYVESGLRRIAYLNSLMLPYSTFSSRSPHVVQDRPGASHSRSLNQPGRSSSPSQNSGSGHLSGQA